MQKFVLRVNESCKTQVFIRYYDALEGTLDKCHSESYIPLHIANPFEAGMGR